jgi:ribonucleoside-triphosphate reductase (thioredoxin)
MVDNVIYLNGDRDTRDMMSDAKFFEGYSRWDDDKNRYETWEEAVGRVMTMHRKYYKDKMTDELSSLMDKAQVSYSNKDILGAQRALQFGGEQIIKNPMRMYNCTSTYADRADFFGEFFHILLCGAGCGVSNQLHHVAKLPKIQNRTKQAKIHTATDDIEGWAACADVLMSSYFVGGGKHPEFEGRRVYFDLGAIRPKGSEISGGFKAPGPEPLRKALDKIEHLLQGLVLKGITELRPIDVYDICMFLADAVLSGGVRRSATIFLFSLEDEEMMTAKTGNWYLENPQRARSNISAVIIRSEITKEQFDSIFKNTKEFGEPGFAFFDNREITTNPCFEIGMFPQLDGVSGWQGCNLTEINGANCITEEKFYDACINAAIIGTLQAGYTNFKFISKVSKEIFEREALLGVSVTGWMNNPDVLLNEEILKRGAALVLETNSKVAKLIGINEAARATATKPSGNASVLLKTASGIHGEPAPLYIRNVQMNKDSEVAQLIKEVNPHMVEESVWSENKSDYVISFPVIAPRQSIFRKDLYGVNLLEKVKLVQQTWIESGTRIEKCVDKSVRHNVSNTISVQTHQWDEVRDYLFDHKEIFAGVSLLSASGDYDYNQAPMTEVFSEEEIISKFGRGALFASGLIVDSMTGFDNLWDAISIAKMDIDMGDKEKADLRANWIRRFKNYTKNYFDGDVKKAEYCLKAVHMLHKWVKIQQNVKKINFSNELQSKKFTEIDTMGAIACSAGACEI